MKLIQLNDLNILDVGNTIQLWGAVYSGSGHFFIAPFPDEDINDATSEELDIELLQMDSPQWEAFLQQTDYLNVFSGAQKAIVRKSQRQIDSNISWTVFKRDGYKCRYCGGEKPLTVDHIDLWEDGGITIEENLISACRRCNKLRGNTPYDEWLLGKDYQRISNKLPADVRKKNYDIIATLDDLKLRRVVKQRSR